MLLRITSIIICSLFLYPHEHIYEWLLQTAGMNISKGKISQSITIYSYLGSWLLILVM